MTSAIGDYAFLSDSQGAALVDRSGSVDWACFRRFDAPSTFARLLDDDGGHWSLAPAVETSDSRQRDPAATVVQRSYVEDTLVVRTVFRTSAGSVSVTDALVFRPEQRGHGIGDDAPHCLVRLVHGLHGEVEMALEVAPRPEYGAVTPIWQRCAGGAHARGGSEGYVLSSPVEIDLDGGTASARFAVAAGQRLGFALQAVDPFVEWPGTWPTNRIRAWLHGTIRGWQSWSASHQAYDGPYAELVHHSGRVLHGLTYHPTGSIVAAATTSLPEQPGGAMNWDYRYAWVRDASLTLNALWVAGCPDEVERFFDFFVNAAGGQVGSAPLQILYGIAGERQLPESTLDHLDGYRDSRPVRVGNEAWRQEQLDVYGEMLDAAHLFADNIGAFDQAQARFLAGLCDLAAERWRRTDHGLWEDRGEPREHVYSKLMCWVALDRGIDLARNLGVDDETERRWDTERAAIRSEILERGWSDQEGAFVQTLDGATLDASALMLPIVGFLPGDDPRVLATIDAIDERLTDDDGLVFRNRDDDTEGEGTFLLATFWMAHAEALAGRAAAARHRFELAARHANDVGLLAEEVDPATGELLGNFPQAFSHVGLINAARAIGRA